MEPSQRVRKGKFKFPDEKKPKVIDSQPLSQKAVVTITASGPSQSSALSEGPSVAKGLDNGTVVTPLRNMAAVPEVKVEGKKEAGSTDLAGKTLCFATDLSSMPQEEVQRRVEAAGGKVGLAISQNTTYVILGGRMPDGRPAEASAKYQRFLELKAKGKVHAQVLTEDEFLKLLPAKQQSSRPQTWNDPPPKQVTEQAAVRPPFNWVDIFAPYKLDQLMGNTAAAGRLSDWLRDWEDVVLRGRKKAVAYRPGGGPPENVNVGSLRLKISEKTEVVKSPK